MHFAYKDIATGETSQPISTFQSFEYFHFFEYFPFISLVLAIALTKYIWNILCLWVQVESEYAGT